MDTNIENITEPIGGFEFSQDLVAIVAGKNHPEKN
jgi:hypothetical protein